MLDTTVITHGLALAIDTRPLGYAVAYGVLQSAPSKVHARGSHPATEFAIKVDQPAVVPEVTAL